MLGLFKKKKVAKQLATQNPPIQTQQDKDYERQRKVISMQKTLEEMKERLELAYKKIDQKQELVKDLIRQKRKAEAKRQLVSLKQLQEMVAKQENMCIILEKTKIQLDVAGDTSKVIDAFKDASTLQKQVETNREFLEDYLIDKKEMDQQNADIGNLLTDIAGGDQDEKDEIDRMYAEFEQETLDDTIQKVNKQQLTNVHKPQVQSVTSNVSASRAKEKKMEESSIDALLAEAAGYS